MTIFAILYVADKIMIGLSAVQGQEVEEKIPHVTLLTNSLYSKQHSSQVTRGACSRAGPLKDQYELLKAGEAIPDDKQIVSGSVSIGGGRDAPSVTCHLIALKQPIVYAGETFIQK